MDKPRRSYARPLADFGRESLNEAFRRQGFAATDIVTRWEAIVGEDIAICCEPIKMQWPRAADGEAPEPATLVLRVEGPAAIEIQHLSAIILERVNRFFGFRAVDRLALRQAPLSRREKRKPKGPDAEHLAQVAARLTGVQDEGLRQALARLGAAIEAIKRP